MGCGQTHDSPRNKHGALDKYWSFSFAFSDVKNDTGRIQLAFYTGIPIMKVEAKPNKCTYRHKR